MHAIGQLFIAAVLIIVCGAILARVASAAFQPGPNRAAGGSRTALRTPAAPRAVRGAGRSAGRSALAAVTHPGNRQIRAQARADVHRLWEEARSADWLEQRRHERANGVAAPAGAVATAAKPTLRQRLKLAPFTPPTQLTPAGGGANPGPPANGTNGSPGGNGTSAPASPAPARQPVPPPPAQPPAASPSSTNGGTTVPTGTSTAGAEQLIEGINRIHAEAAAGGIHHKQAALKSANEAMIRFSGMLQMLARTMSEPGNNYGPEITEPLGQAAQHLQAGAQAVGESDTALATLIHMTVGELASSTRQAPHHSELSENGSR